MWFKNISKNMRFNFGVKHLSTYYELVLLQGPGCHCTRQPLIYGCYLHFPVHIWVSWSVVWRRLIRPLPTPRFRFSQDSVLLPGGYDADVLNHPPHHWPRLVKNIGGNPNMVKQLINAWAFPDFWETLVRAASHTLRLCSSCYVSITHKTSCQA